jgi:hypothetical protein
MLATAIAYTELGQFTTVTSFTPVTVSSGTGAVTLSVSPALPNGLSFNTSTGAITGTPSILVASTKHTVNAVDSLGQRATSAKFFLSVSVPKGQVAYTSAGTFSWTAPAGVTSVSVVAVGGGGGGSGGQIATAVAGGGGGLGYKNNITVIPGNTYTVVVGAGGAKGTNPTSNSYGSPGSSGGDSYFITALRVKGEGGGGGPSTNTEKFNVVNTNSIGGSYVGDGGGDGGAGGASFKSSTAIYGGGGGGAGGYTGAGGAGSSQGQAGSAGSGGGGGGGGSYAGYGGGVGLLGLGGNGTGGARFSAFTGSNQHGGGGSGGSNGSTGSSGVYGGGGASGTGSTTSGAFMTAPSGDGARGAVRIIWPGDVRQFPSTRTGDE